MEDKILDDDDIIDLTDLLEEGRTPQNTETSDGGEGSPASANEPDSFDLGKEISMEYDVSVEEIEHGDDNLDIDASLSSNEEDALTREKSSEDDVIVLEDTGESLERAVDEDDSLEGIDLSVDESEPVFLDEKEDTFSESNEDIEVEISPSEPDMPSPENGKFDMSNDMTQETEGGFTPDKTDEDTVISERQEGLPGLNNDEVIRELAEEIPKMVEGVVRPFMAELVKEIIAVSREQLPGIVEKVIREEIDKLKKLDS
mgnify:CR=1 FL=1